MKTRKARGRGTAAAALFVLGVLACGPAGGEGTEAGKETGQMAGNQDALLPDELAVATFAGGCFWCMESPFEKMEGVYAVVSGYTGGTQKKPTYGQVSSGRTGHREAVQVHYDPGRVAYETLLRVFWRQIDPTDTGGQFADRGSQYRTAVFFHDEEQRAAAERSREELERSGRFDGPIVVEILPAGPFYPAEEHHQDYYRKNPSRYEMYRRGSGRAGFLERSWEDE